MTEDTGLNENGRRRLVQIGAMVAVIATVLFLSSWRIDWLNAWVFLGLYVVCLAAGGAWILRRHPEVVNERGRSDPRTKPFDRIIAPIYTACSLAQYIVAGLDARFGWSRVSVPLVVLGGAGFVVSMVTIYWVMASNPFLAQCRATPNTPRASATA